MTFTVADLHGNARGLKQALERACFNFEEDELIQLGDIVDGYSEVDEVINILLKIKNLVCVAGNHDEFFKGWLSTGVHSQRWKNGGFGTVSSYIRNKPYLQIIEEDNGYITNLNPGHIPYEHEKLLRSQVNYYVKDNNLFIHGGFNRHLKIKDQDPRIFTKDRDFWGAAMTYNKARKGHFRTADKFSRIFIGHTSVMNWDDPITGEPFTVPLKACNVINLDTGAGFSGKVTIMNVETEEYFQSDLAKELYPRDNGRRDEL